MIDEILPGLYCIKVPLPKNPLKYTNSYLIKGEDRFLLIDTGMNLKECVLALEAGLQKLNVDLNKTDFFVTHIHHDHMGLVSTMATRTSRVFFNPIETAILTNVSFKQRWAAMMEFYMANGFPEEAGKLWIANPPLSLFGSKLEAVLVTLSGGGKLEIGDYKFVCIHVPGHSPCHTCLYDKDKKLLFSGDHILFDITPNITCWPELSNALYDYLKSLKKIDKLSVNLVLPGHRSWQRNLQKRVQELFEHHNKRLDEALAAVADGDKTAYEVAPHIRWDLSYKTWEQFPIAQKYFAVGETIAHLEYLVGENKLKTKRTGGKIRYVLA
ncbi:MAG: MBL fold metallo-hydrolase [Dehalococcoidia bacterium]|nr:MBL fold metallo-hydrolase [Dehalococcoidia bacterium]